MALVVVPGAKPHDVLWGCWYLAQRACFDLVALSVVNGCLVPSPHVLDLLFWEQFGCLLGRRPVESADQILTVFPARKSTGSLLLCLMVEESARWWPSHPAC